MRRELTILLLCIGLAVSGCGGNGGGLQTAMPPDPMPPPQPVTCTAPQVPDGSGGCMEPTSPMPTELTENEMAFVRGIVNPSTADDPTTSRATSHVSRPGQSAGEQLSLTPGGMAATTSAPATNQYVPPAHKPTTLIGTQNINDDDSPFKAVGSEGTLGSFMSQTYEKKTRGLTDTVTLFTNRDAPEAVDYASYYGGADGATDQNRPAVDDSVTATGVLNIDEEAATIADYGSLFESDRFPTANKREVTYGDSGATEDVDSDRTLTGSFNGVEGTFKCEGGTCTAMANANGDLIDLVGTWTFTPKGDVKTLKVPDARYDSDYLSFGYWISETTTASGSRFEVGTLFDGSQPVNVGVELTGTATYVGEAAGAYARKGDNPAVGEFTGHASLTANFGAAEALGTIKGTISQLVDGGEAIDPSWTVELQEANIEAADTGATFDGQTPRGGNWRGGFFGSGVSTPPNTASDYPRGVAGDFIGHFENGHVIGAFGATRR